MSLLLRRTLQVVLPLMVIMAVGGLILAVVNEAAQSQIEYNRRALVLKDIRAVFPLDYDNDILQDSLQLEDESLLKFSGAVTVYRARLGNRLQGLIFLPIKTQGYNDVIELAIGITPDGTVTGVRVIKHAETPGLGSRIMPTESQWLEAFHGRSLKNTVAEAWTIRSEGGDFDAFSGASITPRAVVVAVQRVLKLHHIYTDRLSQ